MPPGGTPALRTVSPRGATGKIRLSRREMRPQRPIPPWGPPVPPRGAAGMPRECPGRGRRGPAAGGRPGPAALTCAGRSARPGPSPGCRHRRTMRPEEPPTSHGAPGGAGRARPGGGGGGSQAGGRSVGVPAVHGGPAPGWRLAGRGQDRGSAGAALGPVPVPIPIPARSRLALPGGPRAPPPPRSRDARRNHVTPAERA